MEDGTVPQFSDISSCVRSFPVADMSLDVSMSCNPYKNKLSSVRASAGVGSRAENFFFSLSWFTSFSPYYEEALHNREQTGITGGIRIPRLDIEALGEFEYNIREQKTLYTGGSAVWHYQCVDLKFDVRAFFFREKPEVQFRFSIGLGNIISTSDFLGGRQVTGAGSRIKIWG